MFDCIFIYLVIKYFDFQKELSNDEKIEELEKQIESMRNDYISWQKISKNIFLCGYIRSKHQ